MWNLSQFISMLSLCCLYWKRCLMQCGCLEQPLSGPKPLLVMSLTHNVLHVLLVQERHFRRDEAAPKSCHYSLSRKTVNINLPAIRLPQLLLYIKHRFTLPSPSPTVHGIKANIAAHVLSPPRSRNLVWPHRRRRGIAIDHGRKWKATTQRLLSIHDR